MQVSELAYVMKESNAFADCATCPLSFAPYNKIRECISVADLKMDSSVEALKAGLARRVLNA